MSFFSKLRERLTKSSSKIGQGLDDLVGEGSPEPAAASAPEAVAPQPAPQSEPQAAPQPQPALQPVPIPAPQPIPVRQPEARPAPAPEPAKKPGLMGRLFGRGKAATEPEAPTVVAPLEAPSATAVVVATTMVKLARSNSVCK